MITPQPLFDVVEQQKVPTTQNTHGPKRRKQKYFHYQQLQSLFCIIGVMTKKQLIQAQARPCVPACACTLTAMQQMTPPSSHTEVIARCVSWTSFHYIRMTDMWVRSDVPISARVNNMSVLVFANYFKIGPRGMTFLGRNSLVGPLIRYYC